MSMTISAVLSGLKSPSNGHAYGADPSMLMLAVCAQQRGAQVVLRVMTVLLLLHRRQAADVTLPAVHK
jgi:hypothetical protein